MKRIFTILVAFFIIFFEFQVLAHLKEQNTGITWMDYEQGLALAKKQEKPLFLYFSSEDCPWCLKMQDEILQDPAFIKKISPLVVFASVSDDKENDAILQKYQVQRFPQVVLVDPKMGVISSLGYLSCGGSVYANNIQAVIADYHQLQKSFGKLTLKNAAEFFAVIKMIKSFNMPIKIEEKNLVSLLDQYQKLMKDKRYDDPSLLEIKEQIELLDHKNVYKAHLKMALLEYQTLTKEKKDTATIVKPINVYLERFGAKDPENFWRLQMILAHCYYNSKDIPIALTYVRESYKHAPKEAKKGLVSIITHLKTE